MSQSGATAQQLGGSKGPNVGAIAGGVIGGVVVIALGTYLIWRFFIKKKQQVYDDAILFEEEDEVPKLEKTFAARRTGRSSTVASVASSAFTRASNVIQIAFIPGITDRSGNAIPPVPPIPIPTRPSPSIMLSSGQDHYFMPSDLRDSTFTSYTDATGETESVNTRQSLTPSIARGSVASTIFRNATVVNAEAIQLGRAAMVSVRGTPIDTPSAVPAVPKIDYTRYRDSDARNSQLVDLTPSTAGGNQPNPGLLQPTVFSAVRRGPADLTAAITEATRRASRAPTHGGLGSLPTRDPSPFSDEHEI